MAVVGEEPDGIRTRDAETDSEQPTQERGSAGQRRPGLHAEAAGHRCEPSGRMAGRRAGVAPTWSRRPEQPRETFVVAAGVMGEHPPRHGPQHPPRSAHLEVHRADQEATGGVRFDEIRRPADEPTVRHLELDEPRRLVAREPVAGRQATAGEPAHEQVLAARPNRPRCQPAHLGQALLPPWGVRLVRDEREANTTSGL